MRRIKRAVVGLSVFAPFYIAEYVYGIHGTTWVCVGWFAYDMAKFIVPQEPPQ